MFLRDAQIAERNLSLTQSVTLDQASSLLDVEIVDGVATFTAPGTPPLTSFSIAVYGPDGTLLATGGSVTPAAPEFPERMGFDDWLRQGTAPFPLYSADGKYTFQAAIDVLQIPGARDSYVQLLALPLTPVNQTVANFIGIYTLLALGTVLVAALLTRWLVTLTFRSLGQVEATAMDIASGNFNQRMEDVIPGTEVGRLKTAINAMLDRLDQALGQRDASVQQMRRFIGDASHELRTPLVTVRGYAELYRMGAISGDEQTAQSMERIEKEAIRMGMLVEDLLALARLDERRELDVTEIDLRLIARDAALDARAADPSRAVTFVTPERPAASAPVALTMAADAPDATRRAPTGLASLLRRRPRTGSGAEQLTDAQKPASPAKPAKPATPTKSAKPTPPATAALATTPAAPAQTADIARPAPATHPMPIVLGEENSVRQVVANLLSNARRYTPAHSPIELTVGVDADRGMGWISIIDHGEGVPEQIRDKIFQRFWRADTSRTRETGGSGLGLSIVASIVEALHGEIAVLETPGGGATFRVSFPLAQARDAEEHLFIETQPLPRIR